MKSLWRHHSFAYDVTITTGIVYCFSRADAEKVSKDLNRRGLKAACYHAYLPGEVRKEVHCKWRDNTVQVGMVCVEECW